MLTVSRVTYKIGDKKLVDNVSFTLLPGKINLVLGANGAGKSTLLKIISRQIQPDEGDVYFADKDIRSYSDIALAQIRSVLAQHTDLAFPMTVEEVVMMGRYPHFGNTPSARDIEACRDAISLFDLDNFFKRPYMALSGGEQQRVQFARVMAQIWYPVAGKYRYLILDEPLTFLDIYYQVRFMDQLQALCAQEDLIIVGVVHDLNLAAKYADHLILMQQGKILCAGDKEAVLTPRYIKTAYHLDVDIRHESNRTYLLF